MRRWLLLILLLLPSSAFAHNFHPTDSGTYFDAGSTLYRLRLENKPWQLANLESWPVTQSLHFADRLFLVLASGSQQKIVIQEKPLRFQPLSLPLATKAELVPIGTQLFAKLEVGSSLRLFVWREAGFTEIAPSQLSPAAGVQHLADLLGQVVLLKQSDSNLTVFSLNNTTWTQRASFACVAAEIIERPFLGVFCQSGQVFFASNPSSWQLLPIADLKRIASSDSLLVGEDKTVPLRLHIWQNNGVNSIDLPLSDLTAITVGASRLLLSSGTGRYELLWQNPPPTLLQITNNPGALIIGPEDGETFFLYSSTGSFISESTGQWRTISHEGNFNHAAKTPTGWLIWQTDANAGGLAQFAPLNSDVFTKVNPWSSTTSPVQALSIAGPTHYLSVVTQSGNGNVNLYKTTDFTQWSRVTLPTKLTYSLPISQIRQLASGTLVEFDGVVSVNPGVVDDEITYVQQEGSGIQVRLSRTVGILPAKRNHRVTVTGEVSTSQAKRVAIEDLDDFTIGSEQALSPISLFPDAAASHLGELVRLEGTVSELSEDYLKLRQAAGALKLHFDKAKTIFQAEDRIATEAVVDWNSSTSSAEAWATSGDYQLISRLSAAAPVTITAKPAPAKTSSAATKTAASSSKTTVATAKIQPLDITNNPVQVAGVTTPIPLTSPQLVVLIITTVLAGALSFQGRRFRKYLDELEA